MSNCVASSIRSLLRQQDNIKLNILTVVSPCYQLYDTELAKTGHNFFISTTNSPVWDFNISPLPPNFYHLPTNPVFYDDTVDFDFLLIHNKTYHFDSVVEASISLHLPIICVFHEAPYGGFSDHIGETLPVGKQNLEEIAKRMVDVHIFDTEEIMRQWNIPGNVISPSVDTNIYTIQRSITDRQAIAIGNMINNGILANTVEAVKAINPSVYLTDTTDEQALANDLNQCSIYINLFKHTLDINVLRAIACGCIVISVPNLILETIFNNNPNDKPSILFVNNSKTLLDTIQMLTTNITELKQLQERLLQKFKEHFSSNSFVNNWQTQFDQLKSLFYVR